MFGYIMSFLCLAAGLLLMGLTIVMRESAVHTATLAILAATFMINSFTFWSLGNAARKMVGKKPWLHHKQ